MYFRDLAQYLGALGLHQLSRRLLYLRRNPASQLRPNRFPPSVKPINECFARQDGSRRHGEVGFCLCPLLQANLLPVLQQGPFNYPSVSEFVR